MNRSSRSIRSLAFAACSLAACSLVGVAACRSAEPTNAASPDAGSSAPRAMPRVGTTEAQLDLRPISREAELAVDVELVWNAASQLLAERADQHAVQRVDFPRRATCAIDAIRIGVAIDALDLGKTRVRIFTAHPLRFDRSIAGTLMDELAARVGVPAPPLRAAEGPCDPCP